MSSCSTFFDFNGINFLKIYVFYVHECFVYMYVFAPRVVFIDDCHHVLASALNC